MLYLKKEENSNKEENQITIMENKYSIVKLNNSNYFVWKFKIQLLLTKEGSWDCVTKTKPLTAGDDWDKKDGQGYATIGLNVDDEQLIHIRNAKTAKEAWDALKMYHEKSTPNSSVRCMKQIMRMRLPEGGDMETHLARINELFQQMLDLGSEINPEDWKAATMLGSLPDSYDSLVTT